MRSMFKRVASVVAYAAAFSLFLAAPAMASSADDIPAITVTEYSDYLADEAPDLLDDFEALTAAEQQKFVELLSNPELYAEGAGSLEGVDEGKVATAQDVSLRPVAASPFAASTDRSVSSNRWVKVLGLKVLEY